MILRVESEKRTSTRWSLYRCLRNWQVRRHQRKQFSPLYDTRKKIQNSNTHIRIIVGGGVRSEASAQGNGAIPKSSLACDRFNNHVDLEDGLATRAPKRPLRSSSRGGQAGMCALA